MRMMNLAQKYHAYLVARAENQRAIQRMFDVQGVMFPWTLPVLFGGGLCWLLHLTKVWALVNFLPLAIASLLGQVYAGLVTLVYGIRADLRRLQTAKVERE